MKIRYSFLLLIFFIVILSGCYNEKDIVASEFEKIIRFDLPQGDSEGDKILMDIYNEHGARIIYKSFTEEDLSRSWTVVTGLNDGDTYEYIEGSNSLLQVATYFKERVFDLVEPAISKKIFDFYPEYIYAMYSYRNINGAGYRVDYPFGKSFGKGFDFWMVGLSPEFYYGELPNRDPDDPFWFQEYNKIDPYRMNLKILALWFEEAIGKGHITVPEGFQDKVDTETDLAMFPGFPDYCLARGFAEELFVDGLDYAAVLNGMTMKISQVDTPEKDFTLMVNNALTRGHNFEEKYAPYDLLLERYRMMMDHLKNNYGIDMAEISLAVRSFYSNVELPD